MLYLLKDSHHRVLFQNAAGTINMVQLFDHPDIELKDIAWFQILGQCMLQQYYSNHEKKSKRFIEIKEGDPDMEMKWMSCYVELHRIDFNLNNFRTFPSRYGIPVQNQEKSSNWFEWSKSHTGSYSAEVFTN